jgi:amino acid adenylation domain-containing protein
LFEEQVVRTPDAVAIVYKDKQLTYRELNTLSNQLAHYLIGLGVGPEIMVGICAERSLEMLAGLLGILKAGGAYVPLDPACPEKRLQHMMEDTAVSVVLTQEHLVSRLPKSEVNVVCLDKDWEEIARKGTKNPESKGTSQNLAYVIYTSGSTGTPKGVQISHVALTNVLTSIQQIPGICESDVLLAITTLSFDMAALELFLPLMTGSCVVIAPSDSTYDASLLMEIIRCSGATLMQATPATWNMLISAGWEGSTKLKVLCGGEALTNKLAVQLLPRVKELWNLYGPTETTIFSSVYQVRQSSVIYTGCPIANTQIYILDAHLQPVALGVPGELHIGGDGLARGYLNLPELTAEKFVPDPFSGAPGARLYKTGDFASYAPDGNIRFLGRRDDQIKIRGFRIELQEIGSILAQHDSIKEAIVVASEDIAGEKRLVAYVVPKKASEVSTDGLKYYLAKCLPDYMVPFFFVFLDALPLTSNGKIDRKILPAPDFSHRFLQEAYVPPRTLAEEVITDILAEVLGIGSIGIHDNFFALGGHSILATQVISRLNMTFNITIPLRSFFEMPTVSGLSGVIEEFKAVNKATDSDEVHGRSALSPIKHALLEKTEKGQDAYLPQRRSIHRGSTRLSDNLSFAQERLWFLNRMDPDNHSYNVASGLRLKGKLRRHALQKSLDEIVRRHEVLRTNFAAQDGSPVLVIHPVTGVQIREIDLAGKPASDREAETADILAEEAQRSFDLSTGPLLRVLLLRLHEQEHILLVTVQHIVYDGWSGGVFLRELSVLYEAYAKGEASPLPELKMQYADYAVWQRQWLQGEVLEKQLSYWKQKLQGAPPVLELPLDRPRTAVQTYKGARESLALSSGFTEALKALSQRENVTLFMTLLAAFQVLLYRYTGSEDIVTGTPVANRTLVEIEDLIGFFVNTLVLRTDLSGDPTFREVLGRVRETTLDAYGYQDLPFERLVEELRPERNLSHAPLFQVFFNMASQQQNIANFYDMTVEPLMLPGMQSKFDLTLYVKEQSNNILLSIVYNADLFDSARIHEMLAQYQLLLERMTEEPQLRISGFSLVTQHSGRILPDPAEKLAEPCYEPVTHIFASWALRSPSTPAVSQGGHVRTYRELADSASMLARILVAQGMRPGEVTVLVGPRSYGFVTGFLAVFLSGGVILPIDQRLPADRQRLLLQEANTTRLLYIGELRSEDAWMMEFVPSSFLLDPDEGHVVSPVNNPTNIENQMLPQLSPDDPACIFFTSGTTGVPRGVLGSHKGLSHFLLWQRDTFSVSTEDRCAQLTGPSFDVILRDIFLPLISGAMICLPPKDIDISSEDILSWLAFEKITLLHIVPSLAQNWLLNQGGKTLLPQLRCIFFSGEPLTDQLVLQWRETLPGPGMIINLYGPTETTMVKSFFVVPSAIPPGIQSAGRPLPQTQTLVLSKTGQLCGIGEPGEIVIRTPFRTLGYINFPEEVSGRFVKNPFRDDKDDLLYYTGDLGRYCPDGSLDILGRMDDQVKIRGVRIEPAEVAAVLAGHPDVKACIVASRKDLRQETVLVAYVVPSSADRPAFSELGLYLGKRLPLVMVPSAFVFLESLPLTPNGKVDRRALPGPDLFQLDSAESFVSPGTPEEQSIAGIWSEVLGIQRIGIYDNFFALGGHSLLATRVVSRMNRIFNITIPLRSFFEAPTVSGLSSLMQDIRWQIQGKDPIRNKSDEHASGEL